MSYDSSTHDKHTTFARNRGRPEDTTRSVAERWERTLKYVSLRSAGFGPVLARMPTGLREAVASFCLLGYGIDEIEDHPGLTPRVKEHLLTEIACALQTRNVATRVDNILAPHQGALEGLALRLADGCALPPASIAPRIIDGAASRADKMAIWARRNWRIRNGDDLDQYTYSVGSDALLLIDIWAWYDGTQVDRKEAISYGRCFQAADILSDLEVDRQRGVDFMPDGWTLNRLIEYTLIELGGAERLVESLPQGNLARAVFGGNLEVAKAQIERARQSSTADLARTPSIAVN